jgi:hypothetical protein
MSPHLKRLGLVLRVGTVYIRRRVHGLPPPAWNAISRHPGSD